MKITAVIPIRSGSQRVKDKNIRPFGDTTLLELKIRNLLLVKEIDHIIVNTNSKDAIDIVKRFKENNPDATKLSYHIRDEYFASSKCSGSEFFNHLGEVTDTDIFVYAPCTSPFITSKTISNCIKLFLDKEGDDCDCVSTVSSIKEFLWFDGSAINYDPHHAPNSQDLPNILALNFGCTITNRENLIKNRNIIGKKPQFIIDSDIEAMDIDTPLDFYVAEQLYVKLKSGNKDILS